MQPWVSIVQIFVGALQAWILWRLTYFIFERNAQQKVSERQASWFHKVVIDPQVPALESFFLEIDAVLDVAATRCQQAKLSAQTAVFDEVSRKAIEDFTHTLITARRRLVDRLRVFDDGFADEIGDRFLALQDKVTEWFDQMRSKKAIQGTTSLSDSLNEAHNGIVRRLMEFEFTKWGSATKQVRWRRAFLLRD